jgi:hypothetical protein
LDVLSAVAVDSDPGIGVSEARRLRGGDRPFNKGELSVFAALDIPARPGGSLCRRRTPFRAASP